MIERARIVVRSPAGVLVDLPVRALLLLVQYGGIADAPVIPPQLADITIETHTPLGVYFEDWLADDGEDPDL